MFAAMMLKLMYPLHRNCSWCPGKGGNVGAQYMMQTAIGMLQAQGHSGNLDEIMMVGDRFDTDVRGGLSAHAPGVHSAAPLERPERPLPHGHGSP